MRKRTSIILIISIVVISAGVVFKLYYLAGAELVLGSGMTLFIAFSALFLIDKLSMDIRRESKISYAVLFVAIVLVTLSAMFKILDLPDSRVIGYISLAIFVIYLVFFTPHEE